MAKFRVGIIGGMGPMAGVELHRLIVEATPAIRDQDHLQVLLYTNPQIPDRTTSLRDDDGRKYVSVVKESVQLLEYADVDIMAMACMTAHARFTEIQAATRIPILHGIELTATYLQEKYPKKKVALLATDGSIKSGIYTQNTKVQWVIPAPNDQTRIMQVIYAIKAGVHTQTNLRLLSETMKSIGAECFVLGCTELGLLHDQLRQEGFRVVDPLRVLAKEVTMLAAQTSDLMGSKRRKQIGTILSVA